MKGDSSRCLWGQAKVGGSKKKGSGEFPPVGKRRGMHFKGVVSKERMFNKREKKKGRGGKGVGKSREENRDRRTNQKGQA